MGRKCGYVFGDISTSDFSKQKVFYEYDTTCMYVYIMMRLYQLSGNKDVEALSAARAAAAKLGDRRMDLCWEISLKISTAGGAPIWSGFRATVNWDRSVRRFMALVGRYGTPSGRMKSTIQSRGRL